jgi:hypothetical protein
MDTLLNIRETYKNKIDNISLQLKKNYFKYVDTTKPEKIKLKSYDDMFIEMYYKKKYTNFDMCNLNIDFDISGDIIKDIKILLKKIDKLFLHDSDFKISKYTDKNNYFTPSNENEIYLYNSIDIETYTQTEFRKQLYKLEEHLKNLKYKYTNITDIIYQFYEDDKYDMCWFIIKIIK